MKRSHKQKKIEKEFRRSGDKSFNEILKIAKSIREETIKLNQQAYL